MKLENWSVVGTKDKKNVRLMGKVYGSEKFYEGEPIFTSFIVGKEEDRIKTSSGSIFELGDPSRKYSVKNPNARENLFKNLK